MTCGNVFVILLKKKQYILTMGKKMEEKCKRKCANNDDSDYLLLVRLQVT